MPDNFWGKFYYYDFLGIILPGLTLVGFLQVLGLITAPSPLIANITTLQSTILVIGGILFAGLILQAISSWLERALFFLWGGAPSRKILYASNRFVSDKRRAQWTVTLANSFGLPSLPDGQQFADEELSHTLVRRCQALCLNKEKGRGEEFNAKYGMTRNMLVCCLTVVFCWIVYSILLRNKTMVFFAPESCLIFSITGFLALLGTIVFYFRAKDRGYYWCRELLEQGEELLRQEQRRQP